MQIKTLHTTFRRHLKSLQSTGKLHCGHQLAHWWYPLASHLVSRSVPSYWPAGWAPLH